MIFFIGPHKGVTELDKFWVLGTKNIEMAEGAGFVDSKKPGFGRVKHFIVKIARNASKMGKTKKKLSSFFKRWP